MTPHFAESAGIGICKQVFVLPTSFIEVSGEYHKMSSGLSFLRSEQLKELTHLSEAKQGGQHMLFHQTRA